MRIYRDEFRDEESSDSMGDDTDPLTEFDYAFMYGNFDEDSPEATNNEADINNDFAEDWANDATLRDTKMLQFHRK